MTPRPDPNMAEVNYWLSEDRMFLSQPRLKIVVVPDMPENAILFVTTASPDLHLDRVDYHEGEVEVQAEWWRCRTMVKTK